MSCNSRSAGTIAGLRVLYGQQPRQGGEKGESGRRRVHPRAGEESLHHDLESDEDENRGQHRAGYQFDDERHETQHPPQADKDSREQRVAGPGSHSLVRGMPDVRSGLGDAAAQPGQQGRHRFRQKNVPRLEIVAGHPGALSHVDAADDGQQCEWQRERQVLKRCCESFHKVQCGDGKTEVQLTRGRSVGRFLWAGTAPAGDRVPSRQRSPPSTPGMFQGRRILAIRL